MKLFHCSKCHHEWEGFGDWSPCNWCGGIGYVLSEENYLDNAIKMIYKLIEEEKFIAVKSGV